MVTRVREMLERSRKSLLEGTARQRLEGSTRHLLERSRATVAQLVGPPPTRESSPQEVLVGVCSSVALRDLNLVDSLLEQLEKMEGNEDDPDALAELYKLDHLATRLRRNSENLRVLAGRDTGGGTDETASLVDVIRGAMSPIEHYARVELGQVATLGVVGFAADDVSRLLSELLDNATTHSPPTAMVKVSAHLTEQGSVMVRVEDSGIGLPAARLSALNERLATAPVLDRNAVQHMGLAVVRRLSSRHGINVWLARRAPHGTTASVLLPAALVQDAPVSGRRRTNGEKQSAPVRAQRARLSETAAKEDSALGFQAPEAPIAKGTGFVDPSTVTRPPEDQSPTTPNGLPRRVPQSLKESSPVWPTPADTEHRTEQDAQEGHEQLLADLGDFAEGEKAAQDDHQVRNDTEHTAEGSEQ